MDKNTTYGNLIATQQIFLQDLPRMCRVRCGYNVRTSEDNYVDSCIKSQGACDCICCLESSGRHETRPFQPLRFHLVNLTPGSAASPNIIDAVTLSVKGSLNFLTCFLGRGVNAGLPVISAINFGSSASTTVRPFSIRTTTLWQQCGDARIDLPGAMSEFRRYQAPRMICA